MPSAEDPAGSVASRCDANNASLDPDPGIRSNRSEPACRGCFRSPARGMGSRALPLPEPVHDFRVDRFDLMRSPDNFSPEIVCSAPVHPGQVPFVVRDATIRLPAGKIHTKRRTRTASTGLAAGSRTGA